MKMHVDLSDPTDLHVLWAALIAMTDENHAPQDTMTEEQWARAGELKVLLEVELESKRHEQRA